MPCMQVKRGSSGVAAAASVAASDREKNTLLDDKIALQKEVANLKVCHHAITILACHHAIMPSHIIAITPSRSWHAW